MPAAAVCCPPARLPACLACALASNTRARPGTDLKPLETGTIWKAGGEAEVVFAVKFNHGGGCEPRLPAPAPAPASCGCAQNGSAACETSLLDVARLCAGSQGLALTLHA